MIFYYKKYNFNFNLGDLFNNIGEFQYTHCEFNDLNYYNNYKNVTIRVFVPGFNIIHCNTK